MPSNYLILCFPLLLLPYILPSICVFSNDSVLCIRWAKCWSFSFSISPSNEHSGLMSFRIDRFDLLAVQGPLKSLLQHHSSKVSILWRLAFFMVQHAHVSMTTGKTIALTRQTFVSKVMSLLFKTLSSCSQGSQRLETKKIKSVTVSFVSLSIYHEVIGLDVMILVFEMLSFEPVLLLSSFTLIKKLLSSSLLSAMEWCHLHI